MNTIRVTDLSKDFVLLIGAGYENLYSKMSDILTFDELALFAFPLRNSNSIEWSTNIQGRIIKFDHCDDNTKSKISLEIEDFKDIIEKKLSSDPETKVIAKSIFTVPSRDSIIILQKADNTVVPIITEWGLKSAIHSFNGDPFTHYINWPKAKRNDVNVIISFHNEIIPKDKSVIIQVDNVESKHTMDSSGIIRLGKIFIGSKINVQNPTTIEQDIRSFVVNEEIKDYNLMFDYKTSGKILVQDQHGNPHINVNIEVTNHHLVKIYVTDKFGKIDIPVLIADYSIKATLLDNFEISDTYHVKVDEDNNNFIFVVKTPEFIDIEVLVINQNNEPVSDYPIVISYQEKDNEYFSGHEGKVCIDKIQEGENIIITDKNNIANTNSFKVQKEVKLFIFKVVVDIPQIVTIQLLDHKGLPIGYASIDVKIAGKTFNDYSNEEGKVFFSNEGILDNSKGTIIAQIKNGNNKLQTFRKSFTYTTNENIYIFKLKKFNKRWLLFLLFLLPLLLLIEQRKDIWIKTVEKNNEKVVPKLLVRLDYVRYSLYDKGKFFKKDTIERYAISDSAGVAKFDSINFTWYSLVTKTFKKAMISSHSDCYGPDTIYKVFHSMWNKRIVPFEVAARTIPIDFYVIDSENKYPLVNAKVYIYYKILNGSLRDSAITDAEGKVQFYNISQCSFMDTLYASAYAYYNDTLYGGMLLDLSTKVPLRRTFKLKPIKESIEFFVTDCKSNQPLPDAEATIFIDDERIGTQSIITNVNGVGRGIYKDLHIKKKLKIVVTKPFYLPGELDRAYTVDEFIRLNKKDRTICLDPEKISISFNNIDESNGKPLAGVKNSILLISSNDTTSLISTSNINGMFQVPGITPNSHISISSTYDPYYYKNDTSIRNVAVDDLLADLTNNLKRTIPLKAKTIIVQFRTIDADDGSIMPQVNLDITIDGTHYTEIQNSGNGIFNLEAKFNSVISIVAESEGYEINNLKIRNRLLGELSTAAHSERDIPLELPKCNFTAFENKNTNSLQEWNMGVKNGVFIFEYFTDSAPDKIEIFVCRKQNVNNFKPIFQYYGVTGTDKWLDEKVNFAGGSVITVKVTGSTKWNYKINCPN